jgi:hypothetical protein
MDKIVSPNDWDFGEQAASIVKVASGGRLLGADYKVLVKRAGEEFAHKVKDLQIGDDQLPVHVIAMGATELSGPNRNGDGFKEAELKKTHKTFETRAKVYRNHKNKDPKKSYGQVKLSFYNDAMRRVELLLALNKTAEAAEKYGGLVADKEQETLESGSDLGVSMATKIAFDLCSSCGNASRTRAEYCDEESCVAPTGEKRGGCKHNLTRVHEDGHVLHVDNPNPCFFDISSVFRPADRIAYGGIADYLQKAASGEVLGGAALAELYGVSAPLELLVGDIRDPQIAHQIKLAFELAELEAQESTGELDLIRAFDPSNPPVDVSPLGSLGSTKMAEGLSALASQKVALPLRDFLRLSGHRDDQIAYVAEKVARALPGVYQRLVSSSDLAEKIQSNPFTPSPNLASASQRAWAQKLAGDLSLDRKAVQQRLWKSALHNTCPARLQPSEKQASALSDAEYALAQSYALYKLAFLSTVKNDLPLTQRLVIQQNYII